MELPGEKLSDLACALRITGDNLKPSPAPNASRGHHALFEGRLIFGADDAILHGDQLKFEEQAGKPDIGFWDNASKWVSWNAHADQPGAYLISATIASATGDAESVVEAGGETISGKVERTAGWDKFSTAYPGTVQIKQAGDFLDCLCFQPFNILSPAEIISF